MQTFSLFPSNQLLGTFKTFGAVGPAYEVMGVIRQLDDGDWMMRVRLLETSEEIEYRYARILTDPKAT